MERPPPLLGIEVFPAFEHPMGHLCFGGTLHDTHGTGFATWRRYTSCALILVLGHGRYRDGLGRDERLRPGSVIAVTPGMPHQYGPEAGDRWSETFIVFDGPLADAWRPHGLEHPIPVWHLNHPDRWQRRWERIITRPPRTMAGLGRRLGRFQALMSLVFAQRPDPQAPPWLMAARHALRQPHQDLHGLAIQLGFSPDGFRRAFRRATGTTPDAYRREARLRLAARLMHHHDMTLADIARATGFCDAFHLSKAWKAVHGRSPRSPSRSQ